MKHAKHKGNMGAGGDHSEENMEERKKMMGGMMMKKPEMDKMHKEKHASKGGKSKKR